MTVPSRAPASAELLEAWETGRVQHPLDRALTLLRAFTGIERRRLAEISIGERDELLLSLRRRFFGDQLEAVCRCEHCGEPNEFAIDASALPVRPERDGSPAVSLERDGVTIAVRLPNSFDVAAVAGLDEEQALHDLIARCTIGDVVASGDDVEQLDALMREAEPLAALDLGFACCACARSNAVAFDAAAFLWSDVADASRRLLFDVDALARAYGWSEAEILALSPRRRASYVRLGR
jgi:hypothetical protein